MKPFASALPGALVVLALGFGTPLYGQARPNGGGGGSEGHAVSRPDSGGSVSTSSGSTSGSWGGSPGGSAGSDNGSGGGHSVHRTNPNIYSERRGSAGSMGDIADPGQRAVPRGVRLNDSGNPSSAAARLRTTGDFRPGAGVSNLNPDDWYANDRYSWSWYRHYGYTPGWLTMWGPSWSYYGDRFYDPFWWGLNSAYPYGYGYGYPIYSEWARDRRPWTYVGMPSWATYGGGGSEYRRDPQTAPGPRGGLKLKVEPKDAEVYVDGYFMGVVDDFNGAFQYLTLPVGAHRIEVKAKGYEPLAFDARIEQRDIVTYKGGLQPETKK